MIRRLAMALAAVSASVGAQPPPAKAPAHEIWLQTEKQVTSATARTGFPRTAGPIFFTSTREFSHEGEGIDSALSYRSSDGVVIGTVYVYLPGLSHSGVAAYATDQGIRANSGSPVRLVRTAVVPAGGIEGAAIRMDYENYMGGNRSSAAFIKAGRWTIKIRVSAPEARAAEVDAAMKALLAGVEFGGTSRAHAAAPLSVSDCAAGSDQVEAKLLPDPLGPELAVHGLLAAFDGGGMEGKNEAGERVDLPSRVPSELCLSSRLPRAKGHVPILRGSDGATRSIDGRTRLLAIVSDAGTWLEVVQAPNLKSYVLLFHRIGSTAMLGRFAGVPSDAQIAEVLNNRDSEAARIRVPVTLRPNEGPQIHVPASSPRPSS